MSSFQLKVSIDNQVLDGQSTDKLVIARKVNGNINTVFDGYSIAPNLQWKQLLSNTEFKWSENFKVFLTSSVKSGDPVTASTSEVPIDVGALTTFANSQLGEPVKQGSNFFPKAGCFGIDKVPTKYHAAVKMSTAGGAWSTIYVDRDNHVSVTKITLQPQNEYFLMWRNEVSTETIWALAETDGQKVVFPEGVYSKEIRFGFAKANSPTAGEEPSWY